MLRGGSWFRDLQYFRVSYRFNYQPDWRSYGAGLRLALPPVQSGG